MRTLPRVSEERRNRMGGETVKFATSALVLSLELFKDCDSLGIKMVANMLSHFDFEKLKPEPEIASYPTGLE